jgi:N-acetylglucosamine transport system permease protein
MRHGQYRFIVGFLVLPLALYGVFVISPFVQAFYYSLTNWTGVSPTFDFIGLQNFQTLAQDSLFLRAVRNNLLLLVVMPLAVVLLALFYAFLLNVGGAG